MNGLLAYAPVAAFVVAAVAIFALELRHVLLSALAGAILVAVAAGFVIAPLGLIGRFSDSTLVPFAVLGLIAAARLVRAISSGEGARPWRICLETARIAIPSLLILLPAFTFRHEMMDVTAAALAAVLAALALSLGLVALGAVLPYSESFMTRANRARERRERAMGRLGFVVEPRWALSILGIALIFATLAGFGLKGLVLYFGTRALLVYFAAAAVCIFLGFVAVARDWRMALAATLTLALVGAIALWAYAALGLLFESEAALWLTRTLGVLAMPLALLAATARGTLGDIADMLTGALRRAGATAVSASLLAAAGWMPFAVLGRSAAWPFAMVLVTLAAPFVFLALAAAIHALLPRYRSVEEVFGKNR